MNPRSAVLSVAIVSLLFAVGCGGEPDPRGEPESIISALVNGQITSGHPAVGALLANGAMCTATLVGTKTVLTAAHCVTPGAKHRFVLGNQWLAVASVTRHPSYNPTRADNDVAIAMLEQEPPVTPASISTEPPATGQALTLLGFGATVHSGSGSGVKRVGTNRVAYLTAMRILISGSGGSDANLCFGDSGGPSFATINGKEVQVGVHSTITGTCGQQGQDMRVDAFADWIRSTAGNDLSEDGKPSPFDDQEAPQVQITSPAAGAQVRGPVELTATVVDNSEVAAVSLEVAGKTVSTRTEGPYTFSVALEPGKHKLTVVALDLVDNRGEASVEVEVLPPLVFGEMCTVGTDCASGMCGAQDGTSYCTETCDPQAGCPDDAECLPAGGGRYACGLPGSAVSGSAGGCSMGRGAAAMPAWLLLVGLLGLALGARRRRG